MPLLRAAGSKTEWDILGPASGYGQNGRNPCSPWLFSEMMKACHMMAFIGQVYDMNGFFITFAWNA